MKRKRTGPDWTGNNRTEEKRREEGRRGGHEDRSRSALEVEVGGEAEAEVCMYVQGSQAR